MYWKPGRKAPRSAIRMPFQNRIMSEDKIFLQKITNFGRTTALMLGMLALMLGLGYSLFGTTGLIWAGILGVIGLVGSTQLPSQLIMRMQGARPLGAYEAPNLMRVMKQLSERAGLSQMPRLYYIPSGVLNAFATGNKNDPAIAITHGLLNRLSLRELSGVLAHELSHIRNKDLQLKSTVNIILRLTRVFSLTGQLLFFIYLPMALMGQPPFSWVAILLLIVTGLIIHKPDKFGMFSFAYMVQIHNILAAILVINAFLSLFYHLASGEIKQYLPRPRGFFDQAIEQSLYYLRGIFRNEPHPFEKVPERKLNPLQQVTYFGILNVLLPLQILTGILMWGAQRWPNIAAYLGGLPGLGPFHTLIAWLFATFIVMHVYLTTTGHTPLAGIKSMMLGWDEVEVHDPAAAHD